MSRKIVKRIQRKAMGGTLYGWVYDDGTVRIKADHPSNDPETEIRMAQTAIALLSEKWAEHGLETQVNSFAWRNDPEPAV